MKWKFNVSTFRLLGRELITDRVTALVELIKNSYDANATRVSIRFLNINDPSKASIVISDDGVGMSSHDFEKKWMTIGTDSKRTNTRTPKPFNRRVVGEKGVGRFAIDKLGGHCRISAKKATEKVINSLIIDWNQYEALEESFSSNLFTEIENSLITKKFDSNTSGVRIRIQKLHDIWTEDDIDRVYKEMSKITSPLQEIQPNFDIYVEAKAYKKYASEKKVINEAIKYATINFELNYSNTKNTQEIIIFNKETGNLEKTTVKARDFGFARFNLFYFNRAAKGNFSKNYKGAELQIDGIKIYRNGILTTPFAEHQSKQDNQRDILGLDKRRWSGFFDRVSSRDLIGIIEISKELSPKIIDATNRQDFIDNPEYRDLKNFVIEQIEELEKHLKHKKQSSINQASEELVQAKLTVSELSQSVRDVKDMLKGPATNVKVVQQKLDILEQAARKADIAIKKGINAQQEEKNDAKRKESLLMSLMSLQLYAEEITHIIKTSLSAMQRRAEFCLLYYGQEQFESTVRKYLQDIENEMKRLAQAVGFMSSYARSDQNWEDIEVKRIIRNTIENYSPILEKEKITVEVFVDEELHLYYSEVLFEDMLKNLLNNSVKALKKSENKKIKISVLVKNNKLELLFSDSGPGPNPKIVNRMFEIFASTTSEQGGAGMGLYMVRTNIEAIHGAIDLTVSELGGASFLLTFPFMDKSNAK